MFTGNANAIFNRAIEDYHRHDDVDHVFETPFAAGSLDALLYEKNMVDTVQWHLEDIIRDPNIDPVDALALKRRIDRSNQVRTDMVEYIDSYMLDRLSILALKIYHMRQETLRDDVDDAHRDACRKKLDTLLTQQVDLSMAIEELLEDIEAGRKYMKTYKQMKMYNDPSLNPVLYGNKQ